MIVLRHTELPTHVARRARAMRELGCSERHVERYTWSALLHTEAHPLPNGSTAHLRETEELPFGTGRWS